MPARSARPPKCMPLLRYTSRCGRSMSAVSRYGATTLTGRTSGLPRTPALWITAPTGHRPRLVEVGEVSDDTRCAAGDERVEAREPLGAAGMDDHFVTVAEQGLS